MPEPEKTSNRTIAGFAIVAAGLVLAFLVAAGPGGRLGGLAVFLAGIYVAYKVRSEDPFSRKSLVALGVLAALIAGSLIVTATRGTSQSTSSDSSDKEDYSTWAIVVCRHAVEDRLASPEFSDENAVEVETATTRADGKKSYEVTGKAEVGDLLLYHYRCSAVADAESAAVTQLEIR